MPEVAHTARVSAPLSAVWAFTRDLDNWAQLVTGYQSHTASDETDSTWVIKGDLGGLTRTVELQVHITQWREEDCVEFTLQGANEPVQGSGAFRVRRAVSSDNTEPKAPQSLFARLRDRFTDWLYRIVFRRSDAAQTGTSGDSGTALSEISFELTLNAGGQAGPMLNVLMAPLLEPAARDLATQIAARIEHLQEHPS